MRSSRPSEGFPFLQPSSSSSPSLSTDISSSAPQDSLGSSGNKLRTSSSEDACFSRYISSSIFSSQRGGFFEPNTSSYFSRTVKTYNVGEENDARTVHHSVRMELDADGRSTTFFRRHVGSMVQERVIVDPSNSGVTVEDVSDQDLYADPTAPGVVVVVEVSGDDDDSNSSKNPTRALENVQDYDRLPAVGYSNSNSNSNHDVFGNIGHSTTSSLSDSGSCLWLRSEADSCLAEASLGSIQHAMAMHNDVAPSSRPSASLPSGYCCMSDGMGQTLEPCPPLAASALEEEAGAVLHRLQLGNGVLIEIVDVSVLSDDDCRNRQVCMSDHDNDAPLPIVEEPEAEIDSSSSSSHAAAAASAPVTAAVMYD